MSNHTIKYIKYQLYRNKRKRLPYHFYFLTTGKKDEKKSEKA